jgi:hypothetical protein
MSAVSPRQCLLDLREMVAARRCSLNEFYVAQSSADTAGQSARLARLEELDWVLEKLDFELQLTAFSADAPWNRERRTEQMGSLLGKAAR